MYKRQGERPRVVVVRTEGTVHRTKDVKVINDGGSANWQVRDRCNIVLLDGESIKQGTKSAALPDTIARGDGVKGTRRESEE